MSEWFAEHWLDIVQTAGVAGGLLFSGIALRVDTKVRRTEVILSLTRAHREIWDQIIARPDLSRVLDATADTDSMPPSPAERRFVQLVLLHLATARQAVAEGSYKASPGMDEDIGEFLSLPIPRFVARSILRFQDEEFQGYLRRQMN